MTDESMLYQKVDLLNGLFPNLDTEAEKDICNAILADVLEVHRQLYITTGLIPVAVADVGLGRVPEPVPTQ
ncbi:MAG: hypothetical protein ACI8SJ_000128 [Shewanella sp.]|jgi:hypothetical protein